MRDLQPPRTDAGRRVAAIAMTGWRTHVPVPRPGTFFPILAVLVGLAGLAYEIATGLRSVVRWRTLVEVPAWVVLAGLVLVGVGTFVQRRRNPRPGWYRWWSLADLVEEPGGLRLLSGRAPADHPGIPVRRGDTVEVRATLTRKSGAEREYRFEITSPGGVLTFDSAIYVEKLSMAALDEQAERWGFRVVAHDEATKIRRLRPAH